MEIKWFGQSCFELKGDKATLVIDPFEDKIGLKLPKLTADIVAVTHDHFDHNNVKAVSGDPFVITDPGEYEVKGISVSGIPTFHDEKGGQERGENTVYIIEVDGIRICHLGDLGHNLSDAQADMVDGVDILLIPVGGEYTIDAKKASEVTEQIEPRVVIPMHYQVQGLAGVKGLAKVDDFLSEMGVKDINKKDLLKVKKDKLPQDKTEVVVLKVNSG